MTTDQNIADRVEKIAKGVRALTEAWTPTGSGGRMTGLKMASDLEAMAADISALRGRESEKQRTNVSPAQLAQDVAASFFKEIGEDTATHRALATAVEEAINSALSSTSQVIAGWETRIVRHGSAEYQDYLKARFYKRERQSFEWAGHRWRYRHTSFDDAGDFDVIERPRAMIKAAGGEK